jgi:hypothetical protein
MKLTAIDDPDRTIRRLDDLTVGDLGRNGRQWNRGEGQNGKEC